MADREGDPAEFKNALRSQRDERAQLEAGAASRGSMSLAEQLAYLRHQKAEVEGEITRENDLRTNVFGQSAHNRHCHDFFCVLCFGFTWFLMFAIAIFAWQQGNPYRLVYATDFKGTVCGDPKGGNKGVDLIWYQESHMSQENADFHDVFGFCVDNCPKWGDKVPECVQNFGEEQCVVRIPTTAHFFRCMPIDKDVVKTGAYKMLDNRLSGSQAAMRRYMNDIDTGLTPVLLTGGFGALVLCIAWVYLLGYFPGVMVWGTLTLMLSLLAGESWKQYCALMYGV
jgi:hypothetical protein